MCLGLISKIYLNQLLLQFYIHTINYNVFSIVGVSNGVQAVEEITNVRNQEEDISPDYYPRLCHIKKWADFQGYGFNLHAERDRKGQFIGQIDAGSPADAGGLKDGDRIIEVNGENVEDDSHQQVIQRIKAGGDQTKMLVLDRSADDYFRAKGINVNGRMSNVKTITTPERSKYTPINRHYIHEVHKVFHLQRKEIIMSLYDPKRNLQNRELLNSLCKVFTINKYL